MKRRSFMAMLGLAPAVAATGSAKADMAIPTGNSASLGMSVVNTSWPSPARDDSDDVLRAAYRAGLIDKDVLARAIANDRIQEEAAAAKTIKGYRSFSAVAKHRAIQKLYQERALDDFLHPENRPKGIWALVDMAKKGLMK